MDKPEIREIVQQFTHNDFKENSKGFNFRCVLCGDSKKTKRKKRGWVLFDKTEEQNHVYYCHNCGISKSFKYFVKENYPELFRKYFKSHDIKKILLSNEGKITEEPIEPKAVDTQADATDEFIKFSFPLFERQTDNGKKQLQYTALKMIQRRGIPKEFFTHFRICFDGAYRDRLLIPYFDTEERVYCFQGRDLTGKKEDAFKYLTYKPEGNTKIFNFFLVDPSKIVFVLEGPIDAMFLPNAIATSGLVRWDSDQHHDVIKKFPNRIWVMDNDKDGREEACVFAEHQEKVFCWPKNTRQKDINELKIKAVLTQQELNDMILSNACTGFEAIMHLRVRK